MSADDKAGPLTLLAAAAIGLATGFYQAWILFVVVGWYFHGVTLMHCIGAISALTFVRIPKIDVRKKDQELTASEAWGKAIGIPVGMTFAFGVAWVIKTIAVWWLA